MKKITISDFTGGIQESVSAGDFTNRQWSQLKGIVPSSNVNFETQWAIQTIGSETGFQAVYPLASNDGVFLVGIKTTGTLWWCKVPDPTATATTTNAATWAQITTASNPGWVADPTNSGTVPQTPQSIVSDPNYKFLCSVAVPLYKYVVTVDPADTANPKKDVAPAGALVNASGVLINTATRTSNQQVIVAYIDDSNPSAVKVSAVVFPNLRRFPLHGDNGDFINADRGANQVTTVGSTSDSWGKGPERMHPYTYTDKDGALNPGTGIIPRANVGTVKGDKLILGDIEWRVDQTAVASTLDNVEATWNNNGTVTKTFGINENGTINQYITWPDGVPTTAKIIYNEGPGVVYLKGANTIKTRVSVGNVSGSPALNRIVSRSRSNGISTLTMTNDFGPTSTTPIQAGSKIQVVIPGTNSSFEGTYFVTSVNLVAKTISYAQPGKRNVGAYATTETDATVYTSSVSEYDYKVEVGELALLDNDFPAEGGAMYVHATEPFTRILILRNHNLARHLLNDNNTGPYRGSIYYAEEDLDEFDPRSVLNPSKSDVRIAGLHSLDDTIIAITTAGTAGDGVLRIRGFLSQLHPYSGTANPTAVRIELIRGGIGAPEKTTDVHKNYSAVWSEAGIVVFIDRLGGIFYTDGQLCDRLDRYGPVPTPIGQYPSGLSPEDDHVAALGKHLFAYRAGRLLCFTMLGGEAGRTGTGCWTELVLPSGACKSFVGSREDLYFINDGKVRRFATQAPSTERGKIDNATQVTVTVSTATLGSQDEHDRTNWLRFGMTFAAPVAANPVTVTGVTCRSSGALAPATAGQPVSYTTTPAVNTYADPAVLGEFEVNAGIGPQASASATVTFTGYVQLKSASFWTSGRTPRRGDK